MKHILYSAALLSMAGLMMTSCDNSAPKVDEKPAAVVPTELKIAFVEVDSIMTQYTFCKDQTLVLQKKGQNIQNTLQQKQAALEQAAANFQQKLQQNAYTREQAESIQASLQKQNNDLVALNQRLSSEFQAETDKFNQALSDSIKHYLAQYNKSKKYSFILSKQGDNMLYADKAYDITSEVIAGLNKSYKPAKAAKEEKVKAKEEAKKK